MLKKLKYLNKIHSSKNSSIQHEQSNQPQTPIDKHISENHLQLKNILGKSADVKFRDFQFMLHEPIDIFLCFIDGLVNEDSVNTYLLKPLMEPNFLLQKDYRESEDLIKIIKNNILSSASIQEFQTIEDAVDHIILGNTVIFINGYATCLSISTQGFETRNVAEPDTESTVRGPRSGFNEVLKVNTALVRRIINNPKLTFESMKIGKQTNTNIRIGYIAGIADPKIVDEVKNRIKRIDTDMILESGYIEQFIEDHPFSIFPTIANSEKPDKVAAKILEGRVAIFCDGTPFVLTVPHVFVETLQVGEDYYSRPYLASLTRLLRLLALFITIATPALYIALTTYHHEMVPSLLLTTMAAAEEKVPFPAFIEALLMAITFDLLREAGVRMPRPVGAAISIVGALVIGEAAVQAGLVSAPMVIVIGITGISGFVVSALSDAIILSRYMLMLLAGALGLYGIFMGFLMLLAHICSLRSFGTPYLSPQAPIIWSEWKDSIIRMPLWTLNSRPQSIKWGKSKRQGMRNKPNKPGGSKGEE